MNVTVLGSHDGNSSLFVRSTGACKGSSAARSRVVNCLRNALHGIAGDVTLYKRSRKIRCRHVCMNCGCAFMRPRRMNYTLAYTPCVGLTRGTVPRNVRTSSLHRLAVDR